MVISILILIGFIFGGFIEHFIYTWPRELKFFSKKKSSDNLSSYKWYEYIPIIGFLITKGKINNEKKSLNEVLVPLFNIIAYVSVYLIYGDIVCGYLFMGLISMLLIVIFIDSKYMLIPDRTHIIILFLGIMAAILNSKFYPDEFGEVFSLELWERFVGLLVGFLPIYLLAIVISKLKHTDALGGGDIKLLGAVGFFIGWQNILLAIVLGSCIALICVKFLQAIKVKEADAPFAFGPYLSIAFIITAMYGPSMISWYLGLFGF